MDVSFLVNRRITKHDSVRLIGYPLRVFSVIQLSSTKIKTETHRDNFVNKL